MFCQILDCFNSDYGGTVGLCWNDNYSTTHICKYLFMSKLYSEVAAHLPLSSAVV